MRRMCAAGTATATAAVVVASIALGMAGEEGRKLVPRSEFEIEGVPAAARERTNPIEADKASLQFGELLYSSQCTMCHGKTGSGDGDLVPVLDLELPDLTRAEVQKNWTDGELFWVITHGHGRMPGEGERMQEKWKWDLVNYVRTLDD